MPAAGRGSTPCCWSPSCSGPRFSGSRASDGPVDLVFDEIFYARDACWYVIGTQDVCGITDLASRAHPPLGKWLIGSGIALFGYDPFGWRVASAVIGTATVALVYPLGRRLLRSITTPIAATVGAAAAAGLLAIDFLHLVHSRIGMLDSFITFFVVGAVFAVVLDRDRQRERTDAPWWWRLTLGHPGGWWPASASARRRP